MINKVLLTPFILFVILGIIRTDQAISAESFKVSQLQIQSGPQTHLFTVEVAETSYQRALGLQRRQSMAANQGMLFDFEKTAPVTMWMKNTYLSLDMFFINNNGTIINIARNTTPLSLKHITSAGPTKAVLEVLAGTAKRLNIKVGDKIAHSIFAN